MVKSSRCHRRLLFFSARTSVPGHPPDAELMNDVSMNLRWILTVTMREEATKGNV